MLLNRLILHPEDFLRLESQCSVLGNRRFVNMVFASRQSQDGVSLLSCQNLYACPDRFMAVVREVNDDMAGVDDERSIT